MHRMWLRVTAADNRMHSAISSRFPRILSFTDRASKFVFDLVSHNAFSVISGLVGGVLLITGVVDRGVVLAIAAAWLTAILWVARSKPVLALTIPSRLLAILLSAAVLAGSGWSFGRWSLNKYHEDQRAAAKLESRQPAAAPATYSTPPITPPSISAPNSAPVPSSGPEPEVVIVAPKNTVYNFEWVPGVDLTPRVNLAGDPNNPILEFRKVTSEPVVALTLDWSAPPPKTAGLFLSSPHFSKYKPRIADDGWYWLSPSGPSSRVADQYTEHIEYIGDDPIKMPIPSLIWNGFALRLIAGQVRPHQVGPDGASRQDQVTVGSVSVTYRARNHTFTRRFRLEAAVTAYADGVLYTGFKTLTVPLQYRSLDNLRATLQFSVIALADTPSGKTVQRADTVKPRQLEPVLSASLVNPSTPAILVENSSDTVAENIHWELVMFRLSDHAFCSYATQNIGYVKPHSRSANYDMNLNSLPHAPQTPQLANGDRLIGTISVDCPTCRGTTLIVSFTWGVEGWFYSLPQSTGGLSLPRGMTDEAIKQYIDSIEASIPLQLRHPIQAQP